MEHKSGRVGLVRFYVLLTWSLDARVIQSGHNL